MGLLTMNAVVSLKSETRLFEPPAWDVPSRDSPSLQEFPEFVIEMDNVPGPDAQIDSEEIVEFVTESLATPTKNLLQSMKFCLKSCDAALMDMCGHRRYLGPPYTVSNDVHSALLNLQDHIAVFNSRQEQVLTSDRLSHTYTRLPDVLRIFAFCRAVHQAASSIEVLVARIDELRQRQPAYPRFHLPNYPLQKAIHRTNAQVRHDRGGVTAGKMRLIVISFQPTDTSRFIFPEFQRYRQTYQKNQVSRLSSNFTKRGPTF